MIESSVARPTPHAARAASTAASSHRRAERRRCAGSTERGGARLEFGGGPRLRNGDHRGRIFGLFEGTATAVADGRGTTNSDAPLRHLCRPFPPPSAPRRSVVRAPRRGGVCVGGMGLAARHLASPSTSPRLASPHHLTSPRLASPPHLASLSLRGTTSPRLAARHTTSRPLVASSPRGTTSRRLARRRVPQPLLRSRGPPDVAHAQGLLPREARLVGAGETHTDTITSPKLSYSLTGRRRDARVSTRATSRVAESARGRAREGQVGAARGRPRMAVRATI